VRQVRAFLFPRSDAATKMNFESAMKPTVLVFAMLLTAFAAVRLPAQTVQTLVSFAYTNGATPYAGLTLGNDGNFYGTTANGGVGGTVFKVTTNGTLTTLVYFNVSNGEWPEAALTLGNDGNFYGTTEYGGSSDDGTVFQVTTNGTLTTLVNFNGTNGACPVAALTLGTDGNFYGTTGGYNSGSSGYGTVFQVTTNGTLTTLASFNYANGAYPQGLTLGTDGNFYGTTESGGSSSSNNCGTVFKVTTNGTLTTLVVFNGGNGAFPGAGLTLGNDGNFYGTTQYGTVFKVTPNGTLTILVSFNGTNGERPQAALTLGTDGNFYGTTTYGGSNDDGTVFQVTTNGTLTTLVSFNVTNGAYPVAALTLGTDGNFYGTTSEVWNNSGYGTVFCLVFPPVITSQPQNQGQVLGEDAAFSVAASSTSPLAYQWYFSNPALQTTAGATAQMLYGFVYGAIVTSGGSGYTTVPQVQFIGGGGSGASGTATVSNSQVTAITVTNAGSDYTSPPAVLIDPPNGLLIGQTNSILNLNAITTNNFGSYFVVISNLYGSVTSSVATLTQAYPPSISQQPTNQTMSFGSGANFSVTAAGTPPFCYQWWIVAGQQTNATATPLVTNGFVLGATIISGGAGYLAVPAVQFVGGSGSEAIGTAVVSNRMVTAINMSNAGSGYTTPPVIQIAAPTAISLTGQTNCNLSLAAVTDANAGNYFAVVTSNFGSVTSSPAALTITGAAPQGMTLTAIGGGGLQLQFIGTPNHPYILESATNLASPINWQPVLTNPADASGNWIFTVTNVPACFYRAAGQ
jgi:uncharacterized repeat protein (TIGR03803 family)